MCSLSETELFEQTFSIKPDHRSFCPYRIAPIGAHIDHQMGCVTGMAISEGITFLWKKRSDSKTVLLCRNFSRKVIEILPEDVTVGQKENWETHLRGAVGMFHRTYGLKNGISGVLTGSLPVGGLSSSAAVTMTVILALSRANGIRMEKEEIMRLAKKTENEYVGVQCGKLDFACEMLSRKDHLLTLDCKNDALEQIRVPQNMPPFKIALFFSGQERSLASSAYNSRQDECRQAAQLLMDHSGIIQSPERGYVLRDVPYEAYEAYGKDLPETLRKRADHYFSESRRVKEGIAAWRKGDLDRFGDLMFESCLSSIRNYECGSDPLISIYDVLRETQGVYGARFCGAGFKGFCMALIRQEYEETIERAVHEMYRKTYPQLERKFRFTTCESVDGFGKNL